MVKLSKDQFYDMLAPFAVRARRNGSPIFPSVRLAQSWLETGGTIPSWYNLGGLKVGNGKPNAYWRGEWVTKETWESIGGEKINVSAQFRAYDSIYSFYLDQDLLMNAARYARVRAATTPAQQAEALQLSGYATDPLYAVKIVAILNTNRLTEYDKQAERDGKAAIEVTLNGRSLAEGRLIDYQTWVPARVVGEALGMRVGWNGSAVTVDGTAISTRLIGDAGYVPVRELVSRKDQARLVWNKAELAVHVFAAGLDEGEP